MMNLHRRFSQTCHDIRFVVGLLSLWMMTVPARTQTQAEINSLRNTIGNTIVAATILGGDFGMAGATYSQGGEGNFTITKFGGWGDIGTPQQVGTLPIAWQPQLQGCMGYLTATRHFHADDTYGGNSLAGSHSEYRDFSIEFGGGPRLWFNDHFSIAPTFMGMYGHTENTFYPGTNAWAQSQQPNARELGLVDYSVDTWTIRPALDLQYVFTWQRTIFKINSDPVYFYTRSFKASNSNINIVGNSETWLNQIDVDVPLGKDLWGHEIRTGGYFGRTEFYGDLDDALRIDHLYEIHGRLVLDYLNQFWKLQWIGIGYSYFWSNGFTGHSIGLDVAFQF